MILPRRKFIIGAAAFIAAPAIVRASSLMPIKAEPRLITAFDLGLGESTTIVGIYKMIHTEQYEWKLLPVTVAA